MSIEFSVSFNEQELAKLKTLEDLVRTDVADKTLSAMAVPVVKRAKSLARSSRSVNTGNVTQVPTRTKWGRNETPHFNPATWNRDDSGKHIGKHVFKATHGGVVYIGFTYPHGNKQQFSHLRRVEAREAKYWGRPGTPYKPPYDVMQKSMDESQSEQRSAFERTFAKEVKELRLG